MEGLGFIGFGEAAYHIAKGLKKSGLTNQYAYDVNATDETLGRQIHERTKELSVTLVQQLEELPKHCKWIICATSAKAVIPIADAMKDFLTNENVYIDINAASAEAKQTAAELIETSGAKFADGAVMGSIPQYQHQTPIYLSGRGAKLFQQFAEPYGMDFTYISENTGDASAIKMFRSIFMKGFATLLWETLEASFKADVADYVIDSLSKSIEDQSLTDLANNLLPRTAIHAKRRVYEMEEVLNSLQKQKVDDHLSKAIIEKLNYIAQDQRIKNLSEIPDHYHQLFKEILSQ